jgi:hypothetical protein
MADSRSAGAYFDNGSTSHGRPALRHAAGQAGRDTGLGDGGRRRYWRRIIGQAAIKTEELYALTKI